MGESFSLAQPLVEKSIAVLQLEFPDMTARMAIRLSTPSTNRRSWLSTGSLSDLKWIPSRFWRWGIPSAAESPAN
jgi:hypothetical protein